MKQFRKHSAWLALSLAGFSMLLGLSSCQTAGTLVSSTHFSQNAYDTDKQLKDESLALIDEAKDRTAYSTVADDVAALMQKIDSAIAAEKVRTKNAATVAQWETIKSQLSHFFDLWEKKGALSPAFVDEVKKQVSTLFDTLNATEGDKRTRDGGPNPEQQDISGPEYTTPPPRHR
jgi:hypothetical protein